MSEILKNLSLSSIATNLNTPMSTTASSSEKLDISSFDLPQNYSILINKLEQLALGLDSALGNFSIDRQEVEIALTSDAANELADDIIYGVGDPIAAGRAPPPHMSHSGRVFSTEDAEDFAHVVSDIWIGVILTLLIVFVIFFICACFLYHKFQQWKNSYRANRNEQPIEVCRRCPPDYEAESLPSYTIVSGLPSYDDALEEFRKAGIILTPSLVPIIKIFESNEISKDAAPAYNTVLDGIQTPSLDANADAISLNSIACTCGAATAAGGVSTAATITMTPQQLQQSAINLNVPAYGPSPINSSMASQVIELSPDHLAALSQKRLSLQISFNNSLRRQSRSGSTLRNNLLRSRAVGNTAGLGPVDGAFCANLPPIHRSSSALSLTNEQHLLDHRLRHLHHRGSLY